MTDTILVATDGSDGADAAVDRAIELADAMNATLHAMHVIEDIDAIVAPMTAEQDTVRKGTEAYAEEVLGDVADRAEAAGVPCETTIKRGVPNERILSYAADVGADMIVLGALGRSSLVDVLLGSTADRVSRRSDVSVLLAR